MRGDIEDERQRWRQWEKGGRDSVKGERRE